jgi:hypothetical protein
MCTNYGDAPVHVTKALGLLVRPVIGCSQTGCAGPAPDETVAEFSELAVRYAWRACRSPLALTASAIADDLF